MEDNFCFANLMASKLCHDLIGAINSVDFSMSLLSENANEINKEAIALAVTSSKVLVNRLKYFRIAYGASSLSIESNTTEKIKELIRNLFDEKDSHITWNNKYDELMEEALENYNIKIILNIFLLIFSLISKPAKINVAIADLNSKIGIVIKAEMFKVVIKKEDINILYGNGDLDNMDARNINLYYIAHLKHKTGSNLEFDVKENNLNIAFSLPKKG